MPSRKNRPGPSPVNTTLMRRLRLALIVFSLGVAFAATGGTVAAHLEENDGFCAACHTQPESSYYQRSIATTPTDLASAHTTKQVECIQCHSGAGATGRLDAMVNVGAKDLLAYVTKHYHDPAIVLTPITDDHCLKCHADISQNQEFNNHFHRFLPVWQQKDSANAAQCVDCHEAHATTGEAQLAFLNREHTTLVCQRCHAFAGVH